MSGASPTPGGPLARPFAAARDAAAAALLRAGVGPDAVSWTGFAVSLVAAACLAAGASDLSPWSPARAAAPEGTRVSLLPVAAFAALVASGFLDVVDGAMARRAGRATPYGGFLDSTLDRLSDLAASAGLLIHFAARGHVTLAVLSLLAFAHGALIAYLRSRAEVITPHDPVGFWQRSERCFLLGLGAFWGHLPATLWLLGTLPALTCARRFRHVRGLLRGEPPPPARDASWGAPWRAPRGSPPWVALCGVIALAVVLLPLAPALRGDGPDPLRALATYLASR